ncbi:MAG: PAS domain S-box protein [Gammaproteobacteria bacterium]|uniref:histidine kinase n=1 Tax=Candidatus Thiopontia autotrophica TaxID=2841688 RepID=A0A8J6NWR1_9GAMM|nr:PAS domain S-box protein [Candidatus Thiopontia autotrophica]MBL6968716.1 PAS domain S-box protein [Gammaproteobacteria bacterium]
MTLHHYTPSLLKKSRLLMLFLLPMIVVLFVAATIHFYSDYEVRGNAIKRAEELNIHLAEEMITKDISKIVSDLLFLAEQMDNIMFVDKTEMAQKKSDINQLFLSFANNNGIYDQIRYIDDSGNELCRINYSNKGGISVADSELQNKSDRYYIKEGLELLDGEVYLSPMDLNIENNSLETPYKPVIRFVTPIYSSSGERRGMIVLNYLGIDLVNNFRSAVASITDRVHLVNSDGYWLSHNNPEKEWGFMLGNPDNIFSSEFKSEWSHISGTKSGQFITANGLFSHITVNPLRVAQIRAGTTDHIISTDQLNRYNWKVISYLPTSNLESTPLGFLQKNRLLYIAILFFISLLSLLLTNNIIRREEHELQRANELRFRDTLEEIHLAALTIDLDGNILFCNNYLLHLLRKRRSDVIGKNWFDNFVPDGDSINGIKQILDGEDGLQGSTYHESHIIDFRGKNRLIAWTSTTTINDANQIESITCIGQDITEQHQTREELTKLARAAEQSPAVILITDRTGRIEYVNPKFTELTGYLPQEVIGKNPRILKSGDTSPEEYRDLWQTISSGKEWRGILHNRKKSGELYWESALMSPIRNEDGEITHFLSVKEDITAQKDLEEEIRKRKDELAQAKTLAVVGRMASMVAHDLRNPLSSIKMGLQILSKKEGGNAEDRELHEIGLQQIRYMESILDGLLAYSRPDELDLSWSSLDKLTETAINAIQKQIIENSIDVITHYPAGLPTIQVDKTKMRRVLTNLLSNAIHAITEAAPDRPKIIINARMDLHDDGSIIQLEICDNGTGIDESNRDEIFEPFVTSRSKGTGLGLAIVKRVIEQHNGTISMESNNGVGTCVVITLPVTHMKHNIPDTEADRAPTTFIKTKKLDDTAETTSKS